MVYVDDPACVVVLYPHPQDTPIAFSGKVGGGVVGTGHSCMAVLVSQ